MTSAFSRHRLSYRLVVDDDNGDDEVTVSSIVRRDDDGDDDDGNDGNDDDDFRFGDKGGKLHRFIDVDRIDEWARYDLDNASRDL